jgi:hypothetical protein
LQSTALVLLAFPSPPHLLPSYRAFISLQKDDINKPGFSVGYNIFLESVEKKSS